MEGGRDRADERREGVDPTKGSALAEDSDHGHLRSKHWLGKSEIPTFTDMNRQFGVHL